jgi:hypothetical protein
MIPYNQLTIIRNLYRARELREFRKWVEVYFERSETDANEEVFDLEGARAARSHINRMLPRVLAIVRAAGIGGPSARDVNTDPGQALGRVDVLSRIFTARFGDGVDQEILDLLDMAIGVYDGDRGVAMVRTVNPLYYSGRLLSFLFRGPRRFFGALGIGRRPGFDEARLARLEAVASRLSETEDLIDNRFAALQDHQARNRADQGHQLAELAERLDFVERVIAAPRQDKALPAPREERHQTPV